MEQTLANLHSRLMVLRPIQDYHLYVSNECPDQCPWNFIRDLSPQQIVHHILSPISERIPATFDLMVKTCDVVAVLHKEKFWYMIYKLAGDGGSTYNYFCGGEPQNKPETNQSLLIHEWYVPTELAELYQVHNGFGALWPNALFWNSDCVLPNDKLCLLGDYFSPDSQEIVGYDPNDLLEFFPDGAGNGQFFYRESKKVAPQMTVDWDHETRMLSKAMPFWPFIDDRFRELIATSSVL